MTKDVWLLTLVVGSSILVGFIAGSWLWALAGVLAVSILVIIEICQGAMFDGEFLAPMRRFAALVLLLFLALAGVVSVLYRPGPDATGNHAEADRASTETRAPASAAPSIGSAEPNGDQSPLHEPTSSDDDAAMARATHEVKASPDGIPDAARPLIQDVPTTPPDMPKPNFYTDTLEWADKKDGGRLRLAQLLCPPGAPAGPACQLAAMLFGGIGGSLGEGEAIEKLGPAINGIQNKDYQPLAVILLSATPTASYTRTLEAVAQASGSSATELMKGLSTVSPNQICALLRQKTNRVDERTKHFAEQIFEGKPEELAQIRRCLAVC